MYECFVSTYQKLIKNSRGAHNNNYVCENHKETKRQTLTLGVVQMIYSYALILFCLEFFKYA